MVERNLRLKISKIIERCNYLTITRDIIIVEQIFQSGDLSTSDSSIKLKEKNKIGIHKHKGGTRWITGIIDGVTNN